MTTYRVYISKKTTPPSQWSCIVTTTALNPEEALIRCYEKWKDEQKGNIPPLWECRYEIKQHDVALLSSGVDLGDAPLENCYTLVGADMGDSRKNFTDSICKKINDLLGSKLDGDFQVVSHPSGFHYGITYGANAVYNRATLEDFDTVVAKNAATNQYVLASTRMSTLYKNILQNTNYVFSNADRVTMDEQDQKAGAQIASVIKEFENAGGAFPDQLPFGCFSKFDYVFDWVEKCFGSLDKIPDRLSRLRNAIYSYREIARDSCVLHKRWADAANRLDVAIVNITKPSKANGGLELGGSAYYVGYKNLPTANQLINGLTTKTNKIIIGMTAESYSSTEVDLSIEGRSKVTIPVALFFKITADATASYTFADYFTKDSKTDISIEYQGITVCSGTMLEQSADNKVGWYDNDILREIVEKTGKGETGYALVSGEYKVSDLFGIDKKFSRLKTYVISQEPIINITMTNVETSKIEKDFKADGEVKVSIFDCFNIGGTSKYHVHDVKIDSKKHTASITFGPADMSGTTPAQDSTAFIIGGVPSYPPIKI